MIWRLALACLVLAGVPGRASANGRPPGTSSITFRQGQETDVAVGLSFGFVISHDAGKTWAWMCEDAIGYAGMYDPRFAFSQTGAVFATTFAGLKVVRDSCTFGATPAGTAFASVDALGPDHALYYAAVQAADAASKIPADFNIYRSTDDGLTFPLKGTPATVVNWWQSLQVAPSNAQRVYLSGYAFVPAPAGGTMKQQLLFRSDNAGKDWTALPTTAFTVQPNSVIDVVGIAKDNADHVYARVELYDNTTSDAIWRSLDGGLTWKQINAKAASIGAFVVRAAVNTQGKHDLIVGTQTLGAEISHDDGDTWAPLPGAPHMGCVVENTAGELWACTQNYGFSSVPSDDAGIMKTTDLVTWTKVLRYQDLKEVVACAPGTIQQDTCAAMWCSVCQQLGCTPSASYGCPVASETPITMTPPGSSGGCCETGNGSSGSMAIGLVIGMLILRPRRRREIRCNPSSAPLTGSRIARSTGHS
jgi:hypothetical protein